MKKKINDINKKKKTKLNNLFWMIKNKERMKHIFY